MVILQVFSDKPAQVTFEGTTTFEYDEWEGPLISFSGTDITITGASDHVLDGNGAKWWDGEGSNGGVTKPKFFYAHDLTDSTISGLNILNTPVQCFSVNGASNLNIEDVTIDNSAGDGDGKSSSQARSRVMLTLFSWWPQYRCFRCRRLYRRVYLGSQRQESGRLSRHQ